MARRRISSQPSGFSILVVDDQEETIVSSKLLLEREGHRVVTAISGIEALRLFRDEEFDLVIVDYFMPQMSGEEVVRAIRDIDWNVQIILQTGYSGEKPPRQMLTLLDIQGYHDKSEGPDRLLLWIDVSLKAAGHLRAIHRHEEELTQSREQLRHLSARLLTAQEEERERISRELHDQLGQLLTAIGLDLDWALGRTIQEFEGLRERLREAGALVRQAIGETRELCATLRPGGLDGARLIEEIKSYAMEVARRAPFALRFTYDGKEVDFPSQFGHNIYRIAQEALNNVVRHASASEVLIDISSAEGRFVITIKDDGIGFDPGQVTDPHAVGLVGMRERALLIGGKINLDSAPGAGTTVRLAVPA